MVKILILLFVFATETFSRIDLKKSTLIGKQETAAQKRGFPFFKSKKKTDNSLAEKLQGEPDKLQNLDAGYYVRLPKDENGTLTFVSQITNMIETSPTEQKKDIYQSKGDTEEVEAIIDTVLDGEGLVTKEYHPLSYACALRQLFLNHLGPIIPTQWVKKTPPENGNYNTGAIQDDIFRNLFELDPTRRILLARFILHIQLNELKLSNENIVELVGPIIVGYINDNLTTNDSGVAEYLPPRSWIHLFLRTLLEPTAKNKRWLEEMISNKKYILRNNPGTSANAEQ